jgi:hypothetical protein
LQAFTALFHGGFNGVLLRLLVLRELTADVETPSLSRADINAKLGYLEPDALETVLSRLRSTGLLVWDEPVGVSHHANRAQCAGRHRIACMWKKITIRLEMSYMLTQVAGAQAVGVSVEQLHHLLGRLIELTEEFSDAIASGSEFQLRAAQQKWHTACDWVEKGSQIIHAIPMMSGRCGHPSCSAGNRPRSECAAEYAGHVFACAESDRTATRASRSVGFIDDRYQNLAAAKRRPRRAG